MTTAATNNGVREKILELSFYAFNQKGYKGVSMDLVARELKISKKTIYKHFNSKEEILETAIDNLFAEIKQRLSKAEKLSPDRELFITYFEIYRDFMNGLNPVLREEIRVDIPYLEERIGNFERRVVTRSLNRKLKEMRNKRLIEYPSPTRELSATFFGMFRGLLEGSEEMARFILTSFHKGIEVKKKKRK